MKRFISIIIGVTLCLGLVSCGISEPKETNSVETASIVETTPEPEESSAVVETPNAVEISNVEEVPEDYNTISATFVDVGQADGCVIKTYNNDIIVVDTGEDRKATEILEVLDSMDFEDIDLMILSHPHADHIGGAQTILETYPVKEVLMSSYVTSTRVFTSILDTLENMDTKVTQATLGLTYNIDDVNVEVVGVDSIPGDNNDSSIVAKVTYGDIDMLFTGDAEGPAEDVILSNGYDLNSEILKVGHHGSITSTSEEFLNAINPKMAIISVGEGNKYNHPADNTLNRLKEHNVDYFRTDEKGNIVVEIDGMDFRATFEK